MGTEQTKKKEQKPVIYNYMKLKFLKDALNNEGIRVSNPRRLNDPYEYFSKDVDNFRVACLTTSHNAKLMWSHYADGHRGCLLQIKLPENFGESDCELKKVAYVNLQEYNQTAGTKEKLYKKDKKWKNELEYRAVFDLHDKNDEGKLVTVPSDKSNHEVGEYYYKVEVECIILGCCSNDVDKIEYLQALEAINNYWKKYKRNKKIGKFVKKMKMKTDEYRFVYDKDFDFYSELEKAKINNLS